MIYQRLFNVFFILAILLYPVVAIAENTDPNNDGSQYAYGENAGWLNAEPLGDGGSGVQVENTMLTGYIWAENAGWVSLSCLNTVSCATVDYGVSNDGAGVLGGYAWAENVGWINFAPTGSGVTIDPVTGDFSGKAWGENIGWVTFSSTGPVPYKVQAAAWLSIPTMTEWGMIIFMVLAGLGSIYYLKRKKRMV